MAERPQHNYTGFLGWVEDRFPMMETWNAHLAQYYAPKNFNFWYFFGSLAMLVLVIQIVSGLFLAFQYPVEIPGVGNMTFLRTALNAQRKARGQEEMSAGDFLKLVREKAKALKIDADMMKRPVNVGFSGGEKKRNEILQMAILEPKMCILDETDSGLDVDAMKLVSDGVNALRDAGRGFLVITHYQRLLDHIAPDVVHIMADGRIVKTGGPDLALEVEKNGYADILAEGM